MRRLLLLAAAVLVTAACSPSPAPAPAASPAAATPRVFADSNGLRTALAAAGVDCPDPAWIDNPVFGAVDSISCGDLVLATYADQATAQGHAEYLSALVDGRIDVEVVVGERWTVNCSMTGDVCRTIADRLGGSIVHVPAD